MHKVLERIFSTNQVTDEQGNAYPLHSNTTAEQCSFLQELIAEVQPEKSLEIGLAYGISSVAILEALASTGNPFHHIIIDPFQDSWKNIGLLNIRRAGFENDITFHAKFSDQVVPTLYYEGAKIQFAYIDSTKVFDVLMTDIYYISKILDVNGLIVLDDCAFPGIRVLARFLSQHPAFTLYKAFRKDEPSKKRKIVTRAYYSLLGMLPMKETILPNYNFSSDEDLGLNYSCLAFKKIKEDDRYWNWHRSF